MLSVACSGPIFSGTGKLLQPQARFVVCTPNRCPMSRERERAAKGAVAVGPEMHDAEKHVFIALDEEGDG